MASFAKSPSGGPPSGGQILSKRSLTGGGGSLGSMPTRGTQPAYPPTKLPGYRNTPTGPLQPGRGSSRPVTNSLVPGRLNPDLLRQMAARRLRGA